MDWELMSDKPEELPLKSDYDELTELDRVLYEFGTVEYDFKIHPVAARNIREMFERLFNSKK